MDLLPHEHDARFEKLLAGQRSLLSAIEALEQKIDSLPEKLDVRPRTLNSLVLPDGGSAADLAELASVESPVLEEPACSSPRRQLATLASVAQTMGSKPSMVNRTRRGKDSRETLELHHYFEEHAEIVGEELDAIADTWADANDAWVPTSSLMSSHTLGGRAHPHMLPLHPLAMFPTLVDCVSVLVLLADAILVPVIVVWELPFRGWLLVWSGITLVFWACDMMLRFCTGFIKDACVILDWRRIVRRYLKRGFVFDLTLIVLEGFVLVQSLSAPSGSGALKTARLMRMTKILRLVRLTSRMGARSSVLRIWMVRWNGALSSAARYISFLGVLVRLGFAIFALSHFLACAWYYMLQHAAPDDEDKSWRELIPEMDDRRMYLYAVYWSLTTMFAGASFLPPILAWEIVWSTVLVLIGALFVTSITSTLAAVLIEVQLAWVDMKRKLRTMAEFLEQKGMPALVIVTTLEDLTKNMSLSRTTVTEADVQVQLELLSHNLRALLRLEQYSGAVTKIYILRLTHILYPGAIQELCASAVFSLAKQGDEIFRAEQSMSQCMLISVGQAIYVNWIHRAQMSQAVSSMGSGERVTGQTWACELALLLQWKTVGSLEAIEACEVLTIAVESFIKAVSKVPAMLVVVGHFSKQVGACLLAIDGDWSDISVGIDGDRVVTHIPTQVRQKLVSVPRLGRLRQHLGTFASTGMRRALSELEHDIGIGKCHLTSTEDGRILRVVKLVTMWLEDENGQLCVQLARQRKANTEMEPSFGLPGQSIEGDLHPMAALQGMLQDRFSNLAANIQIIGVLDEPTIEFATSSTYGISTKYIKYVVHASLQGCVVSKEDSPSADLETWFTRSGGLREITRIMSPTSWRREMSLGESLNTAARRQAFAASPKDKARAICEFVELSSYEQRLNNRDSETAVLRHWLSRMSTQQIDALSTSWYFTTRKNDTPQENHVNGNVASSNSSDSEVATWGDAVGFDI